MILNDNICTETGDAIVFQSVVMQNITTLASYTDTLVGVTGTRYFEKLFKYSLDGGVVYCADWMTLTDANLQTINANLAGNYHQLVFLFQYKRVGTDNTGQLELQDITINGTHVPRQSSFNVSRKSMFKGVIENNINTLNLMVNLAQKMYNSGLSPEYLVRGEQTEDILNDEDYVDYWQMVAYYYSVLTVDNIKFENIYWNRPLLCEYLKQRNVFVCNCDDIIEMQLIAQNYYNEMRVRGTEEVFKPKGYEYEFGYRFNYRFPTGFVIMPLTPVMIDGIIYEEISTLPNGWTSYDENLIAPDLNYHKVLFYNEGTFAYDLLPTARALIFPTTQSKVYKKYNGEYLRLICYNVCDEFIYNNVPLIYHGWCVGNSSPLYKGLRPQRQKSLIKGYEKTKNVRNLSRYPLINAAQVYIGVTTNPEGIANDTVMYISANGQPCFPDVLEQVTGVSTHLTLKLAHKASSGVGGNIIVTNKATLESFIIPVVVFGDAIDMEVDTDLIPGKYTIEFDLNFNGMMGGELNDGAARRINLQSTTGGVYIELYDMDPVGSPIININMSFI